MLGNLLWLPTHADGCHCSLRQARSGPEQAQRVLAIMFFIWVLGVALVTGLTRCTATSWSPRQALGEAPRWSNKDTHAGVGDQQCVQLSMPPCGHSNVTQPLY